MYLNFIPNDLLLLSSFSFFNVIKLFSIFELMEFSFYKITSLFYFYFDIISFSNGNSRLLNLNYFEKLGSSFLSYEFTKNLSFIYGLKFITSLLFLIFIRAGLPRYRYDYLTKLGWSKFLLFSLSVVIFVYVVFCFI